MPESVPAYVGQTNLRSGIDAVQGRYRVVSAEYRIALSMLPNDANKFE
jgi:hypothetical protein